MRLEVLIRPVCLTLLGALAVAPFSAPSQASKRSVMLEAMESELTRSMEQLKKQPTPPYFLSYEVTETESTSANGSFGALVSSSPPNRRRILCIDLRVGSYNLDNTRPVRGAFPIFGDNISFFPRADRRRSRRNPRSAVVLHRPEVQARDRAAHFGQNQRPGKGAGNRQGGRFLARQTREILRAPATRAQR